MPFSISFGEQENKPWTQDLHRYRFYKQPYLAYAIPDEIDVRKKAEIYVYPEEGYSFLQRKLCFDTLFAFSGSNWSIRNVRLPWNRWCQLFIWYVWVKHGHVFKLNDNALPVSSYNR